MSEEEFVTVTEAAKILGVARSTVYQLLKDGRLHKSSNPAYKRGGKQKIPRSEVEAIPRSPEQPQ